MPQNWLPETENSRNNKKDIKALHVECYIIVLDRIEEVKKMIC